MTPAGLRDLETTARELAHEHGCDLGYEDEDCPDGLLGVVLIGPDGPDDVDIVGAGTDRALALQDAIDTMRAWPLPAPEGGKP